MAMGKGRTWMEYSSRSPAGMSAFQARDDFYRRHPEAKDKLDVQVIDAKTYTMGYGWAGNDALLSPDLGQNLGFPVLEGHNGLQAQGLPHLVGLIYRER